MPHHSQFVHHHLKVTSTLKKGGKERERERERGGIHTVFSYYKEFEKC